MEMVAVLMERDSQTTQAMASRPQLVGLSLGTEIKIGTACFGFGKGIYTESPFGNNFFQLSENHWPPILNYPDFINAVRLSGCDFFQYRILVSEKGYQCELADTYKDKTGMQWFGELQQKVQQVYLVNKVKALGIMSDNLIKAFNNNEFQFIVKYIKLFLHPTASISLVGTLRMELL